MDITNVLAFLGGCFCGTGFFLVLIGVYFYMMGEEWGRSF